MVNVSSQWRITIDENEIFGLVTDEGNNPNKDTDFPLTIFLLRLPKTSRSYF